MTSISSQQNLPQNVNVPVTEKTSPDPKAAQPTKTYSVNEKYLAAKMPKPKEAKKLLTVIKEWMSRYTRRPHRYDPDRIKDNVEIVTDVLTDGTSKDGKSPKKFNTYS